VSGEILAAYLPGAKGICARLTANRCVESRFQRLFISDENLAAASWYDNALLALNRYLTSPSAPQHSRF
jgi:hypothetical protein